MSIGGPSTFRATPPSDDAVGLAFFGLFVLAFVLALMFPRAFSRVIYFITNGRSGRRR